MDHEGTAHIEIQINVNFHCLSTDYIFICVNKYIYSVYQFNFFSLISLFFQEGPKSFSVFGIETRTNCAVEAFNGAIGRRMKHKAEFFKFVKELREEEFHKTLEFEELLETAGASANPRRKPFYVVTTFF